MLYFATLSLAGGAALVALVGAISTGIVMVRKLGPERDSLFITSAQGAAVIMDGLIETLREEIDRCRAEMGVLKVDNQRLLEQNAALKEELEGLRRHRGRRRGDAADG